MHTEMIVQKIESKDLLAETQTHPVTETRMYESADIFRGQNEIMIRHDGVIYRMKITRQGKLILNK